MTITSAETSINKRRPAVCGLVRQDVDAGDIQYVDFSEIIADAYDLLTTKED